MCAWFKVHRLVYIQKCNENYWIASVRLIPILGYMCKTAAFSSFKHKSVEGQSHLTCFNTDSKKYSRIPASN